MLVLLECLFVFDGGDAGGLMLLTCPAAHMPPSLFAVHLWLHPRSR